jgi:DNA-binding NtrC family response regulator
MALLEQEHWQFDLLFSDVVLPDQSGLALAEEIRSHDPHYRILLSSGYTGQRSQWDRIREKGFCFLQKPYTLPELLTAMRDAIEQATDPLADPG